MSNAYYGTELILDVKLHKPGRIERAKLLGYFATLCDAIGMVREDLHFWDYDDCPEEYDAAPDHVKGTSAVQFIRTSNVTVHALDALGMVYVNIFSCKPFALYTAEAITLACFQGRTINRQVVRRCLEL